jgi:hypothetical protein
MRTLRLSLLLLGTVILAGTFGFWVTEKENASLLDSFYFTLVTVATVVYGDITPRTTAGTSPA